MKRIYFVYFYFIFLVAVFGWIMTEHAEDLARLFNR